MAKFVNNREYQDHRKSIVKERAGERIVNEDE